jgi:hypothetical protein
MQPILRAHIGRKIFKVRQCDAHRLMLLVVLQQAFLLFGPTSCRQKQAFLLFGPNSCRQQQAADDADEGTSCLQQQAADDRTSCRQSKYHEWRLIGWLGIARYRLGNMGNTNS